MSFVRVTGQIIRDNGEPVLQQMRAVALQREQAEFRLNSESIILLEGRKVIHKNGDNIFKIGGGLAINNVQIAQEVNLDEL